MSLHLDSKLVKSDRSRLPAAAKTEIFEEPFPVQTDCTLLKQETECLNVLENFTYNIQVNGR